MKQLILLLFLLASLGIEKVYADPPEGQNPTHESMKPSGRPRQEVAPIDVYYQNGQIWFSFCEDDCGGLSVTLTHVTTGQTVIDYVTDSTPIAITMPSGTILIVCIDDNGTTYTGQIAI